MNTLSYSSLLGLVAPELILVVAALLVLAVDLMVLRDDPLRSRFQIVSAFAILGLVASGVWLMVLSAPPGAGTDSGNIIPLLKGMVVDDSLVRMVKFGIIVLAALTIGISLESNFTNNVGEYLALILFATVGMMLLVSAEDLLMIFVSLELTSLSLYILAAFNKRDPKSIEAALKYFLFGGMSAAFTLFGLSYIYGLTGSTNLGDIAARLNSSTLDPLLIAAIVLTVIGFGFKIAVVPFHLWAPDAYQGAPTPSAAFIASGSKVASFFVLAKIFAVGFAHATGSAGWHAYVPGWQPVLAILAGASMFLGNLAAIAQSNVKRLLAYSAIAHAGYALLGIMANDAQGTTAVVFYAMTYGLTVLGAFAVIGAVEDKTGEATFSSLAGLSRREPVLAFCMMIFMLSLAGIPPLVGFFGKFYLFLAAIGGVKNLGLVWLVVFGIAMSAVSLYYYLQVLKQIYVVDPVENQPPLHVPISTKVVVSLIALSIVLLGCFPNLLLARLLENVP